jgi:hypothetical protein
MTEKEKIIKYLRKNEDWYELSSTDNLTHCDGQYCNTWYYINKREGWITQQDAYKDNKIKLTSVSFKLLYLLGILK